MCGRTSNALSGGERNVLSDVLSAGAGGAGSARAGLKPRLIRLRLRSTCCAADASEPCLWTVADALHDRGTQVLCRRGLHVLLILDRDDATAQQGRAISKLAFDGGESSVDDVAQCGSVVRGSDRHNDRHMAASTILLDDRGGGRGRLALSVSQERDVVATRFRDVHELVTTESSRSANGPDLRVRTDRTDGKARGL
jgi:hypothetical protein